ncbi:DUF7256 domain-containing protein [Acidisoma cladoniae]|uniref:DUF7256 domain-containing protein n=1 Tax=Acidisoma cladoniae TaxID=3040935 RepID=UPI00254F343C|nr:hypothetical protein [Acidisoma sp. PAMC 29798]
MDYAALARLRPLMPLQVLAEIVGPAWTPPTADTAGRVFLSGVPGFAAQVDEAGLLGRVSFYRDFPSDLVVEGLHAGMALDAVRQLYPRTVVSAEQASPGIEGFETALPNGNAPHALQGQSAAGLRPAVARRRLSRAEHATGLAAPRQSLRPRPVAASGRPGSRREPRLVPRPAAWVAARAMAAGLQDRAAHAPRLHPEAAA